MAAKCGPQHIRSAQRVSRVEMESSNNWQGSKSFEDKYASAAKERLDKGPRELRPPEDDGILKTMKQQYAEKKTSVVTPD